MCSLVFFSFFQISQFTVEGCSWTNVICLRSINHSLSFFPNLPISWSIFINSTCGSFDLCSSFVQIQLWRQIFLAFLWNSYCDIQKKSNLAWWRQLEKKNTSFCKSFKKNWICLHIAPRNLGQSNFYSLSTAKSKWHNGKYFMHNICFAFFGAKTSSERRYNAKTKKR